MILNVGAFCFQLEVCTSLNMYVSAVCIPRVTSGPNLKIIADMLTDLILPSFLRTTTIMLRACQRHFAPENQLRVYVYRTLSGHDASIEEINEANERCHGEVKIKLTNDHGWGVFALKDYSPDERVMVGKCLMVEPEQGTHTIQTDWKTHVFMDLPSRYSNHVCGTANLGIKDNEHGAYDFYAISSISAGEELRWDYSTSEYEIENFKCSCESPLCRRFVKGFRSDGSRTRAIYGEKYIANYLKTKGP